MGGGGGFFGTILNVVSLFVPVLRPVAIAVNLANSIESGNLLGVASGAFGMANLAAPAGFSDWTNSDWGSQAFMDAQDLADFGTTAADYGAGGFQPISDAAMGGMGDINPYTAENGINTFEAMKGQGFNQGSLDAATANAYREGAMMGLSDADLQNYVNQQMVGALPSNISGLDAYQNAAATQLGDYWENAKQGIDMMTQGTDTAAGLNTMQNTSGSLGQLMQSGSAPGITSPTLEGTMDSSAITGLDSRSFSDPGSQFAQSDLDKLASDNTEPGVSFKLDTGGGLSPERQQFADNNWDSNIQNNFTGEGFRAPKSFGTWQETNPVTGQATGTGLQGRDLWGGSTGTYNPLGANTSMFKQLGDIFNRAGQTQRPMGWAEAGLKGIGALDSMAQNRKAMEMMEPSFQAMRSAADMNTARGQQANNMWTQNFSNPQQAFTDFMGGAGGQLQREAMAKAASQGRRGNYINTGRMNSDLYSAFLSNLNNRGNAIANGFANPSANYQAMASAMPAMASMTRNQNAPMFDVLGNIAQRGLSGLFNTEE